MNFIAIAEHTPAQCPGSNEDVFNVVSASMPQIPELEKKHGVTNQGIYVTLGLHKMVIILDAPSYEAAEHLLLESKMISWNTVQLSQAYTLEQAMAMTMGGQ